MDHVPALRAWSADERRRVSPDFLAFSNGRQPLSAAAAAWFFVPFRGRERREKEWKRGGD
jgi:hypothetical protein